MPGGKLIERFAQRYQGDVKDPILRSLLEALEGLHETLQDELLLSAYSPRVDIIPDAMFEVLRRHLFGQMFPGPAYVIATADLREPSTAEPVPVYSYHYFSMQDPDGNKTLFAPLQDVLVVPAFSNEVVALRENADLRLRFSVPAKWLSEHPQGTMSLYCADVNPMLIARMRCRIELQLPHVPQKRPPDRHEPPATSAPPGLPRPPFVTPFEARILNIPVNLLARGLSGGEEESACLVLPGLGHLAQPLAGKLTLNAFVLWNMMQAESVAERIGPFRYRLPVPFHEARSTEVMTVHDTGSEPAIEYASACSVMDPGYPFQYTTSSDPARGEIYLALSPQARGRVTVRFCQYELRDNCIGIPAGSTLHHHEGVSEQLKTVQSLAPTQRLDVFNDKEKIWEYFRSLLASRRRWLTRDDLRHAVMTFPPFSENVERLGTTGITFEEKVGRVRGFLTPFTEITIPVGETELLAEPDRSYFERQLGLYIKSRTVHGNFVRARLTPLSHH